MTKRKSISLVQLNDLHGYMENHWEYLWQADELDYKQVGGLARISSYLKTLRKEKNNKLLFLDGGDTFHGTYPVVKTKGEILPEFLNELKIDAMTAHWDFAYGPDHLKKLVEKLDYPMLACNCYDEKTDELIFPPYLLKEVDGLKLGIIGIAATIVDKTMPKHFSEGVYLTLGREELPKHIKDLKEKEEVDLIVLLSHLGFPQEEKLAQEVDGIDVLLSAHTHNRIYDPVLVNDTIIIQSGCHGSFLGRLDLELEDGKIVDYKHELVLLDDSIEEDQEVLEKIEKVMKPYREELDQLVGYTKIGLNRNQVMETTMDNLLLESILDYSGAQMAFSNGWRYGAPIPAGPIRENDLWNIIPVNPPVSVAELSGQELWDMMEENLENTFSRDPYKQMGGYVKRSLGIYLYFKIENPKGARIQRFFVGDELLDKNKTYQVAYVTAQGVPEKYGKNKKDLDLKAIDVLKRYLDKHDEVNPVIRGSILAV